MRYYDPAAYRFFMVCAEEDKVDRMLIQTVRSFLEEIEDYIIHYAETEPGSVLCTYKTDNWKEQGMTFHTAEMPLAASYLLLRSSYLRSWNLFKNIVESVDFTELNIEHLFHIKDDQWYRKPSSNQKELNSLSKLMDQVNIGECDDQNVENHVKELLYKYLNCPDDSLRDIAYSSGMMDCNPFHVRYYTHDPQESGFESITGNEELDKSLCRHIIDVQLPRYLFHDGFPFQRLWTERLFHLCGRYEYSYGGIALDSFVHGIRMNEREMGRKQFYFNKLLPGYSWAACYSPHHVKMLGENVFTESMRLFQLSQQTANQGIFLQMSSDIDCLSRETNDKCIHFLSPYCSDADIHCEYTLPFSFRESISVDEIHIHKLQEEHTSVRYSIKRLR